jgi:hypothetical protein
MQDLPEMKARVRVWPAPGRRVQLDARPVAHDKGGRFLTASREGQEVIWSMFHVEQLRAGDIFLHCPEPALVEHEPEKAEEPLPPAAEAPLPPASEAPRKRSKKDEG